MPKKITGIILAFIIITLLSLLALGIDIPLPSSYLALMFTTNAIFAFVSIFLQRLVIVLYEVNVCEEPKGISGLTTKYFAIFSSGINYYVQKVLNRLPFIFNKFLAIVFFLIIVWNAFCMIGIFD